MPCRDDYGPSCDDSELIRVRANLRKSKEKADLYARLLCFIMSNITVGEKEMLYRLPKTEEHGDAPEELLVWWTKHQEQDRIEAENKAKAKARAEAEAIARIEQATTKRNALKKLSSKERKALGLA